MSVHNSESQPSVPVLILFHNIEACAYFLEIIAVQGRFSRNFDGIFVKYEVAAFKKESR